MGLLLWGTARSDQAILTTAVCRLKARLAAGSVASAGDGRKILAVPSPVDSKTAIFWIQGSEEILPGLAPGSGAAGDREREHSAASKAWGGDF
jgi:hypothetical protein